ncbi:MAG: hypothetical protein JWQ23_3491 [Herminiimonas sp.]|nr:hypothetical protein [Herminiimonas sp.]
MLDVPAMRVPSVRMIVGQRRDQDGKADVLFILFQVSVGASKSVDSGGKQLRNCFNMAMSRQDTHIGPYTSGK